MAYFKSILKGLVSRTALRRFVFPKWRYNFSASDLVFMCGCIDEVKLVDGVVIEVGCEYGETTLFLNNYLAAVGAEKKYICIDTFNGFTERDLNYEVYNRAKVRGNLLGFRNNSRDWFLKTLRDAGYGSVQVIEADASSFNYSSVYPISFALVDIDLFMPIRACLPKVYDALSPGGIIVVDDCDPSNENYDGAFYAYIEFIESRGMPIEIFGRKLGLIRKGGVLL